MKFTDLMKVIEMVLGSLLRNCLGKRSVVFRKTIDCLPESSAVFSVYPLVELDTPFDTTNFSFVEPVLAVLPFVNWKVAYFVTAICFSTILLGWMVWLYVASEGWRESKTEIEEEKMEFYDSVQDIKVRTFESVKTERILSASDVNSGPKLSSKHIDRFIPSVVNAKSIEVLEGKENAIVATSALEYEPPFVRLGQILTPRSADTIDNLPEYLSLYRMPSGSEEPLERHIERRFIDRGRTKTDLKTDIFKIDHLKADLFETDISKTKLFEIQIPKTTVLKTDLPHPVDCIPVVTLEDFNKWTPQTLGSPVFTRWTPHALGSRATKSPPLEFTDTIWAMPTHVLVESTAITKSNDNSALEEPTLSTSIRFLLDNPNPNYFHFDKPNLDYDLNSHIKKLLGQNPKTRSTTISNEIKDLADNPNKANMLRLIFSSEFDNPEVLTLVGTYASAANQNFNHLIENLSTVNMALVYFIHDFITYSTSELTVNQFRNFFDKVFLFGASSEVVVRSISCALDTRTFQSTVLRYLKPYQNVALHCIRDYLIFNKGLIVEEVMAANSAGTTLGYLLISIVQDCLMNPKKEIVNDLIEVYLVLGEIFTGEVNMMMHLMIHEMKEDVKIYWSGVSA